MDTQDRDDERPSQTPSRAPETRRPHLSIAGDVAGLKKALATATTFNSSVGPSLAAELKVNKTLGISERALKDLAIGAQAQRDLIGISRVAKDIAALQSRKVGETAAARITESLAPFAERQLKINDAFLKAVLKPAIDREALSALTMRPSITASLPMVHEVDLPTLEPSRPLATSDDFRKLGELMDEQHSTLVAVLRESLEAGAAQDQINRKQATKIVWLTALIVLFGLIAVIEPLLLR